MSEHYVLPKNWEMKSLCDICIEDKTIIDGRKSDLPFIGLEMIKSNTGVIDLEAQTMPGVSTCYYFDERHILYGKLRPYLNKVALPDFKGRCSTELVPLFIKPGYNREFVLYLLRRNETVEYAMKEKTGSRMPRVNMQYLLKMKVMVPPLEDQKRIAKLIEVKLAAVDKAKNAINEQISNSTLLKDKYYEYYFNEYTSKYELGNYCSIVNGSTPKTGIDEYWNGNIVWITPTDLGKNKNKYIINSERKITEIGYNSANTTIIKKNNIILSTRAPIGYIAINNVEACTNQGCKSILPSNELNVDFLYYYLKFNKDKLNELGSGTTFKELSTSSLMSFKIPVPSIAEQKRIANIIEIKLTAVIKAINVIDEQSVYISALPSSILKKAFQGEL
jgi:type I restriction enzyme S subunit